MVRKNFLVMIFVGVLACSILTGCGNNSDTKAVENGVSKEKVTSTEPVKETEFIKETETIEQTEPIEEKSVTWFEKSGLSFTPTGDFTCLTSNGYGEDVTAEGNILIDVIDNGDGTKTIKATLEMQLGVYVNYGFVDQYTGNSIVSSSTTEAQVHSIEYEKQKYDISVVKDSIGSTESVFIRNVNLTCPTEYNGAAFFVCGSNADVDNSIAVTYNSYEDIEHGNYDILLFEGIDTEN